MKHFSRFGRSASLTALIAVLLVVGVACGARGGGGGGGEGGENFTIRLSHVVTPETPKGMASERFKELVEEGSEGRITVEIYPNSELYGDEDELQALQSGSVQMLAPATAKFTTIAPAIQVLDLPFIFDSVDEIPEVASPDTNVGQAIFENQDLRDRNIRVLGLWDNGLKQLSSDNEMRSPEDLQGLEFRIQPSDVLRSQFRAWGADATPLAFAEVYNALQQGVIDGQENPYSNIESQNMHTVQDYITVSNHGYIGYVLTINEEFYQSLPDDLKQVVDESAEEASAYNREIAEEVNDEALQVIEEEGSTEIIELTDEERQAFKDEVAPSVWEEYSDVICEDIIQELLEREEAQGQ
ncbi:MAG: DctP family TRAP transporter solute-binding subunit [Rubrobacter sp.]